MENSGKKYRYRAGAPLPEAEKTVQNANADGAGRPPVAVSREDMPPPVSEAMDGAELLSGEENAPAAQEDTPVLRFERPQEAPVIHLNLDAPPSRHSVPPAGRRQPAQGKTPAAENAAHRSARPHRRQTAPPLAQAEKNAPAAQQETPAPGRPARSAARKAGRFALRTLGAVGLFLFMVVVLAFGAITMLCKGPFPTAKELFVVSVNETSAVKFLSRIYFSKDEVEEILTKNAIVVPAEVTDTTQPFAPAQPSEDILPLEIVDVYGSTYKGKMMIVQDPSRIRLATLPQFGNEVRGKRIEQFVADEGALAGINAGGFADEGGVGKGGQPLGLVIHNGQIVSGAASTECNIIGFDQNNRLVVGVMTGSQALEMGVRDAVHFTPTLVVNGTPAEVGGTGGGLNPRTVIGQRADGAVLLLVIDGRQPHSVGATLQDCMQEMLNFGAVNAANLDGGSSSMMVYDGEVINTCASLNGSRSQPAAWLVM